MKNKNNIYQPLVSVVVLTYNSSKTVVETLESIKLQSYKKIELVITDDSSQDSTLNVCKKWCDENSHYFENVLITKTETNLGVANNCNNGVQKSHGEWIKIIAGDDLLEETCIESNIVFLSDNPNCRIVFSKNMLFDSETKQCMGIKPSNDYVCPTNVEDQFIYLLKKDFVIPTTLFIEKKLLYDAGLYNNKYPFMEDYPMWYRITKKGIRIYYNPIVTVRYRISVSSLSNSARNGAINMRWLSCYNSFFHDCLKPELLKRKYFFLAYTKQFDLYVKMKYSSTKYNIVFFFFKLIGAITGRFYDYLVKA